MTKRTFFLKATLVILLVTFSSILFMSCESPEVKLEKQANSYYDQGQWDNAIAEYGEVLKLNPNNIEALVNRGSAYSEKGEFDQAIADCSKAIEIDANNVIAYYNRSIAYLRRGDTFMAMGNAKQARTDWESAVKDCSQIIDSGMNNSFVLLYRGLANKNLKNYNAAEADLNKAMVNSTNADFNARVKTLLDQLKKETENAPK